MRLHFPMAIGMTLALVATLACQTPRVEPIRTVPLRPQAHEALRVEHLVVIVDSSGSMDRLDVFPEHKALVEAFVGSLPDGAYQASQVAYGGYERQVVEHAAFDRERLTEGAASLAFLDEASQLDQVLLELRETLETVSGTAALVIFSDGRPTAPGGWRPVPDETLEAAQALVDSRADSTCFFTVQSAGDEEGAAFLETLAALTPCGAHRNTDGLNNIAGLHSFARKIFLGDQVPNVAAARMTSEPAVDSGDGDGDGVANSDDSCPKTPVGARVLSDGCWEPPTIYFGVGQSRVPSAFEPRVGAVSDVLFQNSDLRVRIDGYTDSSGDAESNHELSERRARDVQRLLEEMGVSPERIEVRARGEIGSPYSDETDEDRDANRRIEFLISR
jgi:outer membrane protein OmpA-like peptidoglycan-associated protein